MKFKKNKEIIEFENNKGRKCPFINEILSACHCSDMRSMKVEEAIYYCGTNYTACKIYKDLNRDSKAAFTASSRAKEKAIAL